MDENRRHRGCYLAPALVYVALIWLAPLVYTTFLSATDAATYGPGAAFTGLDNYRELLGDPGFRNSLRVTGLFAAGSVALHLVCGFLVAHVILASGRWRGLVQALVLFPWVISEIAAALAWQWLLHEESGLANLFLTRLGMPAAPWLSNPSWAMASLLLAHLWRGMALSVWIQLAGLQSIPHRLTEAARLDGAGALSLALRVRLPLMRRLLAANAALVALGAISAFTLPYALMKEGGPLRAIEVLSLFLYRMVFSENRLGYGAAAGIVALLGFVLLAAVLASARGGRHAA